MHHLPKYLKHSSGQARVVINGKAFYLGRHGSKASRQRYDAILAEWLASNRSPTYGLDPGQTTIADLMLAYLRHAKSYYGSGQNSDYNRIRDTLKVVRELYTDLEVVSFGPSQFKAVRQRMIDHRKWARTNINRHMRLVLRMLKWGASEGMYPATIYETLRLIPSLKAGRTEARETEPVKPVCTELVAETIKHCSPVMGDMIRTQLLIGCRPDELCRLTPAMIDQSGPVWEATLDYHKTKHRGKVRTIYFGPEAQRIITPYLARGEHERLFTPKDSERSRRGLMHRTTPMNCGNRPGYSKRTRQGRSSRRQPGEQYTTQSYGRAIRYACLRANPVPETASPEEAAEHRKRYCWSPNQLRHTAATDLRKRFGLEAAGVILGHSQLAVTQVYAEADRQKAIEIVSEIG